MKTSPQVVESLVRVLNEKKLKYNFTYDEGDLCYLTSVYEYKEGYISIFNAVREDFYTRVGFSGTLRAPYWIYYCIPNNAEDEDFILFEKFVTKLFSEKDFNNLFQKTLNRSLFNSILNDVDLRSEVDIYWSGIPYIKIKDSDAYQSILNLDYNMDLMTEIISRFGRLKNA